MIVGAGATTAGAGTTVVVVTHERDLVNRFRKRVVMLEQGLITGDGVGYEAK